MNRWLLLLVLVLLAGSGYSQQIKEKRKGWHLLDLETDGYYGISLSKAYELLKGRKSTPVIVAVIDSGIDTLHEDLLPILWRNPKEIGGNGLDDDKNGYIDDVYGWNFCGSKTGTNLSRNSHEITRVYHGWKSVFEGKKEKEISTDQKFLYSQWVKAKAILEKDYEESRKSLGNMRRFLEGLEASSTVLTKGLGSPSFTVNSLNTPSVLADNELKRAAEYWKSVFSQVTDTSITSTSVIEDVRRYKNDLEAKKKRMEESPEDWRGELTQDKYTDINDRFYGNNNLKEGSGNHGTSVAGVIAAVRNNGIGMDGIADNVRIMAIRAVPGGDEHDKDVSLAIRYAVDNGAKVINMSFGKPVSPYKEFVDEAVRYAASKGVLLVHGSGNSAEDVSMNVFYPNPEFLNGQRATNFLNVGASGDLSTGSLSADFSNYSKEWVDVFAPGVYIHCPATNNQYETADGTSLAAPVAAGIAALLKSYFPELSPSEIISILKESGTPVSEKVKLPGDESKMVYLSDLCISGKILNAAGAVKLALAKSK
jgi:cell wall-associated protease